MQTLHAFIVLLATLHTVAAFPNQNSGRRCFDASTIFTGRSGPIRADELKVGDEVLVATQHGNLVWDTIAVDASHIGAGATEYLQIETSDGRSLHVTPNHYLHATHDEGAGCCSESTLVAAEDLQVGHQVWTVPEGASGIQSLRPARVTAITSVEREGAHSFWLAEAGDASFHSLIANGVAASSFAKDMRLVHTLGFRIANRMLDPLREMTTDLAKLDHLREADRLERDGYRNPLMDHLRPLEDVIADCVEMHMHECDLEARAAAVWQQAVDDAPEEIMDAIGEAVDTMVYKHTGVQLPGAVRRLATSVASHTGLMTRMTIDSVREQSERLCKMDEQCRADMPHTTSVTLPLWAFSLVVGLDAIAVLLAIVLAAILVVQCRRRKPAEKATATAPAAPQRMDVCDAA